MIHSDKMIGESVVEDGQHEGKLQRMRQYSDVSNSRGTPIVVVS